MNFPPMELAHLIYFVSGLAVGGIIVGFLAYMAERS